MGFFGSRRRRLRAEPLQPLVDPAAWEPEEILNDSSWAYTFTLDDIAEVMLAVYRFHISGTPLVEMRPDDFVLWRVARSLPMRVKNY